VSSAGGSPVQPRIRFLSTAELSVMNIQSRRHTT
jgi:hypothetical protein